MYDRKGSFTLEYNYDILDTIPLCGATMAIEAVQTTMIDSSWIICDQEECCGIAITDPTRDCIDHLYIGKMFMFTK